MINEAEHVFLMGVCTHTCKHTQSRPQASTDSLYTGASYQDGQGTRAYGIEERTGDFGLFSLREKRIRAFLLLCILPYNCHLMTEGVEQSQILLRRVQ